MDLRMEFKQDPHHMECILQTAKVEKTKEALNAVVASLSALPHTPVEIEPDLCALRAWMDAHRAEFDAFKTFCDNYRPPSPMEDGEVHPRVDLLLKALRDIEIRIDGLERKMQPPWVNDVGPQSSFFKFAIHACTIHYQLQRRVKMLHEVDAWITELFSRSMNAVEFCEMSAEGQRTAIQQHVLKVARDTFDGMLNIKRGEESVEGLFWLRPLSGGAVQQSMEEDEDD
ncbi:hypothetical protein B0H19DRAFT_1166398 [Mycena capillaripes]|nr:hypothetical protein B0H19DRAFT_1166398 [Mycena capillaripes]